MLKRIISLILCFVLVLSFSACSNPGTDKEAKTEPDKAYEGQEDNTENVDNVDPNAAYQETVTLKVALMNYPGTGYAQGDSVTDNPWIRSYLSEYNIKVEPAFVSDYSDYATKINLAIAEGKLPDVFQVNAVQLQQLMETDLLYDMTDIYDTLARDDIKGFMASEPESFASGQKDGKLYGIPQLGYGYLPHPDFIWIRKDWKEALQLKDPETMDDIVNIAKAFMNEYGGYGIAADQSLSMLKMIAIAWGAHPDMWIENAEGNIVYGSVQPEMKEALEDWAGWYKDGILSVDFATTNNEKINEDTINGKVGVYPWYQWWGYTPGTDVVANLGKDAIFEPYAIPSANGEKVLQNLFCDNSTYIVVSKKCENPEAVMKCINYYTYMTEEARGVEEDAVVEAHTSNAMTQATNILRIINPLSEYSDYGKVREALDKNDPSIVTTNGQLGKYNSTIEFMKNGTSSAVGDYLQQGSNRSAYSIAKPILDNQEYIKNKLWAFTPETLLNAGATLEDILCEGYTKIIMGEETIDYFDTVVANWMAAGGEQATVEMNEMYQ